MLTMKKKKRWLSMFLSVCMLLSIAPTALAAGESVPAYGLSTSDIISSVPIEPGDAGGLPQPGEDGPAPDPGTEEKPTEPGSTGGASQPDEGAGTPQPGSGSDTGTDSNTGAEKNTGELIGAGGELLDGEPSDTAALYVSEEGNDESGAGTQEEPYASLAHAVEEAQDGDTIYVVSDLTAGETARITDKNLTIKSWGDKTFTITRGETFSNIADTAQSWYNGALIEVTTNDTGASERASSVRLENIILDDGGEHAGTYFVQTNQLDKVSNTDVVQDSMVTAHGLEDRAVHIILGEGAVLKDFGGMSALYGTSNAHISMEAGSKIIDDVVTDRGKSEQALKGETGPAGAVWLQGSTFEMADGAEIENIIGRALYIDGGQANIGGTIRNIQGDADMWQGFNGVAAHIRDEGWAVLEQTGVIDTVTGEHAGYRGAVVTNGSRGEGLYDFEAKKGSVIRNVTNFPTLYSNYGTELLNGTIESCSNDFIIGGFMQNTTIGQSGVIRDCTASKGAANAIVYTSNGSKVYLNGTIEENDASYGFYIINQSGGGASLKMSEGAILKGKGNNTGVYVNASNSSFTMDGGEISGFSTGVYCRGKSNGKATFIMNGGRIFDNKLYALNYSITGKSVVELLAGEIVNNGSDYQISASGGSAQNTGDYIRIKPGVLKENTMIYLSFSKITLGQEYSEISLGKASDAAKTQIVSKVQSEKGTEWNAQGYSALWFKPTTDTFRFTMPRPNVDNILYAGYIPLNENGTPAEDAQLTLIQLEGNEETGSVTLSDTLDVSLTGLTAGTPYALMLIKSPNIIVRPLDLAKYVTGDDRHEGDDYTNCFPDPRYEGIPEDAAITVSSQEWDPATQKTQYPFTINYYEQDGTTQIQDDHDPGNYIAKVEILPGLGARPNDILINGQRVYLGTGTLSVRAVSNASEIENIEEAASEILTEKPTEAVDTAVAVMPKDISYLVNGIRDEYPNVGAKIRLLHDELLAGSSDEDPYVKMMRERLEQEDPDLAETGGEPRQYAMKYLDLIDANDSNIIVTASLEWGKTYDIYLPYPSGTGQEDEFRVFDFEGLDRSYTAGDYGAGVESAIKNSEVKEYETERSELGIKVTIPRNGRLGAMALTWQQTEHTITATAGEGGTISPSGSVKVRDTGSQTFTITPNSGYRIKDVTVDGVSQGALTTYLFENVTNDHSITVTFAKESSGGGDGGDGGGTTSYIIEASAGVGGSISPNGKVRVTRNSDKAFTITPDEGYMISDVLVDGESVGAVSRYTFKDIRANHEIEVIFRQKDQVADPDNTGVSNWLNTSDHVEFLHGYTDGSFGPNNNMTRSEVAQMFYNLLLDKDVPVTVSFDDVAADAWYADAVNKLASIGVIKGVGNNDFAPDRAITRAEFTVIAMRFADLDTSGENIFSDVDADDWFYDQVIGSIKYGWINGYEDGTFRPNNTITRAEVTTITNRMLGRVADEDYIERHAGELRRFPDVSENYWAYFQIVEATNAHDFKRDQGVESWIELQK